MVNVKIEKAYDDVVVPEYSHEGDSGMDIRAYFTDDFIKGNSTICSPSPNAPKEEKTVLIREGETVLIPSGIKVALPSGYEIQVRSRSGLSLKQGLVVLNSPGTVDECYRGDIGIILHNSSREDRFVAHGDRIAQIVLQKVPKIEWYIVDSVDETKRSSGGFGSTGIK